MRTVTEKPTGGDPSRYKTVQIDNMVMTPKMVKIFGDLLQIGGSMRVARATVHALRLNEFERFNDGHVDSLSKGDIDMLFLLLDVMLDIEEERENLMRYPTDEEVFEGKPSKK